MIFTSLEFLTVFLPLFLLVYVIVPAGWRNAVLLVGSWIFYGWWSPVYLVLLWGLTAWAWAGALALEAMPGGRWRKATLGVLVALNAGILFWYKYINILVETYNQFLPWIGALPVQWQRVGLPIGLSFIVLQAVSYLADVYRGEARAQRNVISFAAFIAMFGQLIAGPILRYGWVEKELIRRRLSWLGFSRGARRFMVGMCMKVLVADTLSPLVDMAFGVAEPGFLDAWLACLAYTLQLFFDFAGYSAMAIGLGQMLGFHFPENFRHPYLANSIQDFWRRWHISLSTWIRDYLYIPLGGNRNGVVRTYVNLLFVMAIAGMWHGSDNWNFLLWGLLHGVALSVARWWTHSRMPVMPGFVARGATLLFVAMAWVVFRATDISAARALYAGQLGLHGWALDDSLRVLLQGSHVAALLLGLICIVMPLWRDTVRARLPLGVLAVADLWPVGGFVLSLALVASRKAVPFLYFQF